MLKLINQIPSKLLLAGDGPERVNMERLCRQLGICGDVRFLGKIGEVEEVLSIADLFLMPSEKESFGLAALEAMACSVPVVSSNVGGLPELNLNGQSGFVSNVGDIEDMVKNSLYILNDEHLDKFREQALSRAKEFDIKRILPQYEAVYEQTIEKVKKELTVDN